MLGLIDGFFDSYINNDCNPPHCIVGLHKPSIKSKNMTYFSLI